MFSLKADHVLRVHVIVFKSEVNEEKWSQNFFLDKHHFVVLQRSSSQMTTHASKSKREEDKLPNRFSVNFYDFEKKNPPPLHSFSEKEMSSSLFTWWYYDEVMTSWRGNLLTLKSAANNHVQILFLSLLCVSFSRDSCRRQWTKRTYMYNIWRFELLPVRFLTCSKRISVKTMQGCNCYDLAMGHPQKNV